MKTTTKITGISKDDLENLFITASYGSDWLHVRNFCDKYQMCDYYAEDETDFYGELPHEWNDEDECMVYTITIGDIEKGIAKCIDMGMNAAWHLIYEPEQLDMYEANAIMQVVVFGEEVYG